MPDRADNSKTLKSILVLVVASITLVLIGAALGWAIGWKIGQMIIE